MSREKDSILSIEKVALLSIEIFFHFFVEHCRKILQALPFTCQIALFTKDMNHI